jgi:hypothetical protein
VHSIAVIPEAAQRLSGIQGDTFKLCVFALDSGFDAFRIAPE